MTFNLGNFDTILINEDANYDVTYYLAAFTQLEISTDRSHFYTKIYATVTPNINKAWKQDSVRGIFVYYVSPNPLNANLTFNRKGLWYGSVVYKKYI